MSDLDPKLTFESFVVGPANRLASAAARRAAESPGTSYNPLFLYSSPGLGKTHILMAIAHHSAKGEAKTVEYHRVQYDIESSAQKIFDADLALNFGKRLFLGV